MKWVILGLVLINVAFFGWRLGQDQEVVVAQAAAPPPTGVAMVNRLLLVSEVESGVLRRRRMLPSQQGRQQGRQQAAQQSASPPQPQAPEQLAAAREETASVPLTQVLALPPVADRECYTLGPLENDDDISALSAWFNAQGSQATLRSDERREVTSTWVFLPPLASREAADALVREMQSANIDDIYVIPRGDMANAISLGLFSQSDTLQRRVSQLEERGFAPSVLPRYRTATASWFDVTTSAAQPMTVGVLDQIFPDLIIRQVPCGDAAIAGDPAISYNPSNLRQEGSYSDNASGAALEASGRSDTQ